ncbi:MAG TPA: hypothetical protein VFU51_07600 [Gaiellaceae bacterium]|jgi:hypothetical protein|nr:hypothetical protein [Gaiellaceae bacterium]
MARIARTAIRLGVLLVTAALAVSTVASGATHAGAELRVGAVSGDHPEVDISFDFWTVAREPGRVVLYEPVGFNVYPNRPAGSIVGRASLIAANSAFGTPTYSSLAGDVLAHDPSSQATCGAPSPIGLWDLELTLVGQPLEIPLLLDGPSAASPAPSAGSIALCVPVTADGAPLPIVSLAFSLDGIPPPSRHGSYLWRAVVTPLGADRRTLQPSAAYELRATVPVLHRLTLTGARSPGSRAVVLGGRLTAAGKARAGVSIRLVRLSRVVTPGGIRVDDAVLGWTTTGRDGSYSFRTRATGTNTFRADAEPTSRPCRGPSIAPAGCLAVTFPSVDSDPVTVR